MLLATALCTEDATDETGVETTGKEEVGEEDDDDKWTVSVALTRIRVLVTVVVDESVISFVMSQNTVAGAARSATAAKISVRRILKECSRLLIWMI